MTWIELALICGIFLGGFAVGMAVGGVRRPRSRRPVETIDLSRARR